MGNALPLHFTVTKEATSHGKPIPVTARRETESDFPETIHPRHRLPTRAPGIKLAHNPDWTRPRKPKGENLLSRHLINIVHAPILQDSQGSYYRTIAKEK